MAERIYSLKNGPISVQIEANRKFMVIFSRKVQNAIIRDSLNMVGAFWANVFLPKRFTNYAKTVLGFNPSHAWQDAKAALVNAADANSSKRAVAPQPTPLVYRGEMRQSALARWSAQSIATQKKQILRIRIPLGHPVKKHIADLITRVPRLELQRIVDVFAQSMKQVIAANAYGPQPKLAKPRKSNPNAGAKRGAFAPIKATPRRRAA